MEILHQRFGGYKSVVNDCGLGVNLVIDNSFRYFPSLKSNLFKIKVDFSKIKVDFSKIKVDK